MIPWVREKFAERRAKWLAARNKRTTNKSEDEDDNSSTSASDIAPRLHRLQDNPEDTANSTNATVVTVTASPSASLRTPQTAHRSINERVFIGYATLSSSSPFIIMFLDQLNV